MGKENISEQQLAQMVEAILPLILEKGPSHTSMDVVASSLGMSKRTLYEIFENKDDMLRAFMEFQQQQHYSKIEEIFQTNDNTMEAMVKVIDYNTGYLKNTSSTFFRDMDERCKHLRPDYDSKHAEVNRYVSRIILQGIHQGMFRKNCDYNLNLRLLRIQIESIKRMEDFFPSDITIDQAFRAIGRGFLRSIATPEGIEVLERIEKEENQKQHKIPANNKELN